MVRVGGDPPTRDCWIGIGNPIRYSVTQPASEQ